MVQVYQLQVIGKDQRRGVQIGLKRKVVGGLGKRIVGRCRGKKDS